MYEIQWKTGHISETVRDMTKITNQSPIESGIHSVRRYENH